MQNTSPLFCASSGIGFPQSKMNKNLMLTSKIILNLSLRINPAKALIMFKRQFGIFSLATFFILLNSSCADDVKNHIGDKGVISIGDVIITEYELEKNLNRFIDDYRNLHNTIPGNNDIQEWIQSFIDRTYFLADAYNKGYNEKEEVIQGVKSMERLMIAKPHGLLEEKLLEKELVTDEKEIELAKQRSTKRMYVEYLQFNDFDSAQHIIGNNTLKDAKEFQDIVKRSTHGKNMVYNEDILIWPYINFWEYEEYLFSLNKGDITPILNFNSGYYVFYIKDIDTLNNSSPEILRNNLKNQKTEKIRARLNEELQQNATLSYNPDVLHEMEDKLQIIWPINEFDKDMFSNILQQNAFSYFINDHEVNVSVSELMDNYNYRPFRQEIANHFQLNNFINSIVYNEYAYLKAKELGITQQTEFLLDRENYTKSLVYAYYEENELIKKIIVPEEEIKDRYNLNKNKYSQPANAMVSIFIFNTEQNAGEGMFEIMKNVNDSVRFTRLKGLQGIEWNKDISYNSAIFPDKTMTILMQTKNKGVSMPCEVNGKYVLFMKKYDHGQRIRQLNEVRDMVKWDIINERLEKTKWQLLAGLKEKYHAVIKVDNKKYDDYAYKKYSKD